MLRPPEKPTPVAVVVMAGCAVVAVAGCGRSTVVGPDDIRSYTVPREASGNRGAGRPAATTGQASRLKYEVPAGWSDRGGSGMRLATLTIGDPAEGREVTVIPASGTLRANVERWQGQLDTDEPGRAAAVDRALAAAETVDVDGVQATVVALFDAAAAAGPEAAGRAILGAMIPVDDSSALFVKFTGDAEVARRERDNFVRFVESVRWR